MKRLAILCALIAGPAMAHPGHGEAPGHWLSDGDHLAVAALAVALVVALVGHLRRQE